MTWSRKSASSQSIVLTWFLSLWLSSHSDCFLSFCSCKRSNRDLESNGSSGASTGSSSFRTRSHSSWNIQGQKIIGSPGLVVIGGDSCSKGRDFCGIRRQLHLVWMTLYKDKMINVFIKLKPVSFSGVPRSHFRSQIHSTWFAAN